MLFFYHSEFILYLFTIRSSALFFQYLSLPFLDKIFAFKHFQPFAIAIIKIDTSIKPVEYG